MNNRFSRRQCSGRKLVIPKIHGGRQQQIPAGQLLVQTECAPPKLTSEEQYSNTNYLTDGEIMEYNSGHHSSKKLILIPRKGGGDVLNGDQEDEVVTVAASAPDEDTKRVIEDMILMQTEEDDNNDFSELYSNHTTADNYVDTTPQLVTEEVITDDWVQHPDEESRVEIPAEQIISSSAQGTLDMEVPLPTTQDAYSYLRPYPCDFCSRRFRKKANLIHHMISHQNNRLHLCKICNSRFSRPKDLINHLKIHSQEVKDVELEDDEYLSFEQLNIDNSCEGRWNTSDASKHVQKRSNSNLSEIHTKPVDNTTDCNALASLPDNKTVTTVPALTTRGRISRLKLKENLSHSPTDTANAPSSKSAQLNNALLNSDTTPPSKSITQLKIKPSERKPFICYLCGLSFAREKAMLAHAKIHRKDSLRECSKCNEQFGDQKSYEMHKNMYHIDDSTSDYDPNEIDATEVSNSDSNSDSQMYGEYYCSECGLSFHRMDLLKRHRKIHNKNGGIHSCSICGEAFAEALDLLAHSKTHGQCFKCVLCGDTFYEEIAISQHLEMKHTNEISDNTCMLCGKDFRDQKALSKHVWDHSNEKNYNCSKCGKNFHNKTRLKRHMSSHRNKSVECKVCHEFFPDGRTLLNHRHSHNSSTSGKLFPCHQCGKTFGSRSSQQIHLRIHTGERPYGCRFCWKAFADGGTLRKHERIHTGEKPYACTVCSRAFNQRVVLREHIRSHHSGIDPVKGVYCCSVCNAELDSSNDLIQHLIQHSDVNTAMTRQPMIGPRKYKRRRKLKPHEIARLKHQRKPSELSHQDDTDVTQIDFTPLLNNSDRINETTKNTANFALKSQQKANNANKMSTNDGKVIANSDNDDDQLFLPDYKEKSVEKVVFPSKRSSLVNLSGKQKRNLPNNLNKSKTQKQTRNSLTANTEYSSGTFTDSQDHDGTCARVRDKLPTISNTKSKTTPIGCISNNLRKTNLNSTLEILHIENQNGRNSALNNQKMAFTNYDTNRLIKSATIVDDYDIISPALHPPKQISISPLDIKHETANVLHIHQLHQPLTNDIYDNQLLLECSSLRNDLEDILQSPIKLEKYTRRARFISGSSTQFEVSDEEHFIKHEPASPDLREIVNSNTNFNNIIELNVSPNRPARQPWLSTSTANLAPTKSLVVNSSQLKSQLQTSTPKYTAITSIKRTLRKSEGSHHTAIQSVADTEAFLDYSMDSTFNTQTPANTNNSFSSISAVVSAADATVAAQQQQHLSVAGRKRYHYFECEMCSAVFTDRAQLLDHVPIHI